MARMSMNKIITIFSRGRRFNDLGGARSGSVSTVLVVIVSLGPRQNSQSTLVNSKINSKGATHTQHTAPQKNLGVLLPPHSHPPHVSSLHSYPQIPHLTPTENPSSPSSSLLQKTPSSPSSSLALQLGSSFVTLLKSVSATRHPRGKWSRLTRAPRR